MRIFPCASPASSCRQRFANQPSGSAPPEINRTWAERKPIPRRSPPFGRRYRRRGQGFRMLVVLLNEGNLNKPRSLLLVARGDEDGDKWSARRGARTYTRTDGERDADSPSGIRRDRYRDATTYGLHPQERAHGRPGAARAGAGGRRVVDASRAPHYYAVRGQFITSVMREVGAQRVHRPREVQLIV